MLRIVFLFLCVLFLLPLQATENEHISPEIRILLDRADSCMNSRSLSCLQDYEQALQLAEKRGDKNAQGWCHYKICFFYLIQNQVDEALQKAYLYLPTARASGNKINQGMLCMMAGGGHLRIGKYLDSSAYYFIEGSKCFEEEKDYLRYARCRMNLGTVSLFTKNTRQGLQYYKEAYTGLGQVEGRQDRSDICSNIALLLLNLNQPDSAFVWANRSLADTYYFNRPYVRAWAYRVLGEVYTLRGEKDSARYYSKQAFDMATQVKDKELLANAYLLEAKQQRRDGQPEKALELAMQSVTLQETIRNLKDLRDVYQFTADLCLDMKQYEEAASYYQKLISVSDSVLNERNIEMVNELNARYENEKKERLLTEQQLEIQQQRKTLQTATLSGALMVLLLISGIAFYRVNQKARLQAVLREKETAVLKAWMEGEERERGRISRELHDGVAAMLGAARLNLGALAYQDPTQMPQQLEKVSSILDQTHTDIRRIAHNLLPITLQQEGLLPAIRQFVADINAAKTLSVHLETSADPLSPTLPENTRLILFRIVQELVANVLRHAQASEVNIRFNQQVQLLRITVEDNGSGLPDKIPVETHGLLSIRDRMLALGGSFEIHNRPERKGAIAHISLPFNP